MRLGEPLLRKSRVDSTMRWARDEVEAGRVGPGAGFMAGAQTEGRGRHGRGWASPPGKGLYLTLVLPGSLASPCVTLAGALATAEAVGQATGLRPLLKWPNDLLLQGRKLGGVLAEVVLAPEAPAALLGVGLNVLHEESDFGPELARAATSLALSGATGVTPEQLLAPLLERLGTRLAELECEGFSALAAAYLEQAAFAPGDRFEIAREGAPVWPVTFVGLDAEGRLLVEESPEPVSSATVLRIRKEERP